MNEKPLPETYTDPLQAIADGIGVSREDVLAISQAAIRSHNPIQGEIVDGRVVAVREFPSARLSTLKP